MLYIRNCVQQNGRIDEQIGVGPHNLLVHLIRCGVRGVYCLKQGPLMLISCSESVWPSKYYKIVFPFLMYITL